MIIDGIQCTAYQGQKITLTLDMRPTYASNGLLKWADLGASRDNFTIEMVVTAEGASRTQLETLFVNPYTTGTAVPITFEDGDSLYAFTDDFVILDYELVQNPNKWEEYGAKIKIAPESHIDLRAVAGSRGDGCGNMTFGGAKVEQPRTFTPTYPPIKYTGLSNGGAYSKDMPHEPYTSTKWNSIATAENMRDVIDEVLDHRGNAFSVDFPATAGAFGLLSTAGLNIVKTTSNKYEIEQVDGNLWKIGLEAVLVVTAVAPTITVQPTDQTVTAGDDAVFTAEATGTAPLAYQWEEAEKYTFFSAPTFSETGFGPFEYPTALPYDVTYNGTNMVVNDATADNFVANDYYGKPSYIKTVMSFVEGAGAAEQFFLDMITAVGAPTYDRVQIARGETSLGGSSELIIETIINSVSTKTSLGNYEVMTDVTVELTFNGSTMGYVLNMVGKSANTYNLTGTISNAISPSSEYVWWLLGRNYVITVTEFEVEGVGYPSIGYRDFAPMTGETSDTLTLPDMGTTTPYGNKYRLVVSNGVGSDTSNEVTTIEA